MTKELEREEPRRDFHIGDILSVTTRRMLSLRGMEGVCGILDFMMGGPVGIRRLLEVSSRCSFDLLKQHPQLTDVDISGLNEENWRDWLGEQVVKYGQELPVEAIPLRDRVAINSETMMEGLLDSEEFIFTSIGDESK